LIEILKKMKFSFQLF